MKTCTNNVVCCATYTNNVCRHSFVGGCEKLLRYILNNVGNISCYYFGYFQVIFGQTYMFVEFNRNLFEGVTSRLVD